MRALALLGTALALAGLCAAAGQRPAQKTDSKDGKAQAERMTPFGPVKSEQKQEQGKGEGLRSKAEAPPNLRAYDEGEQVRFESRLPFGISQYRKKKSELNEAERAALERDTRKPSGK